MGQLGKAILLYKRKNTYYIRLWIPLEFREHFGGKSDIKKSLKTRDPQTAKTLAAALRHDMETFYAGIRLGMLSEEDIKRIRSRIIGETVEDLHSQTNTFGNLAIPLTEYGPRLLRYAWSPDEVLSAVNSSEQLDAGFINEVRTSALSIEKKLRGNLLHPSIRTRAKNIINDLELDVNAPVLDYTSRDDIAIPDTRISPHFIDICLIVAKAAVETVLLEYGKVLGLPNDERAQTITGQYKEGLPVARLAELWNAYAQQKVSRGKWGDSTATKNEDGFAVVSDILGNPRITEIGSEKAEALIEGLLHYPKNKNKKAQFKGKPFSLSMAKMEGFEGMSVKHINFHVELMSTLFKYALEDRKRWRVEQNPFIGKQITDTQEKEPHEEIRDFTKDELQKIFAELSVVRRVVEPDKFWIPLICLYEGTRANEACQLRTDDIEIHEDMPVIHVCHKPHLHQKTKNRKSRILPIHKALIELGFMSFVEQQAKKGEERLFPRLTLVDGKWYHKVSAWFNRTILVSHMGLDEENVNLHSTKHTFINWYKQNTNLDLKKLALLKKQVAHFDDNGLDDLLTKFGGITMTRYGKPYPEAESFEFLNQLDYGIDLKLLEKKK